MQKQNIVILGSTGSIGKSTLSVIENNPQKYHAFALVGGKNVEAMFEQCIKFRPHFVLLFFYQNRTRADTWSAPKHGSTIRNPLILFLYLLRSHPLF